MAVRVRAANNADPGNPSVNFRGEQRGNKMPQNAMDPASVCSRKAQGKEGRLCFDGHSLMEHQHGLRADFTLHNPITEPEPVVALRQADAHQQLHEGVARKNGGSRPRPRWTHDHTRRLSNQPAPVLGAFGLGHILAPELK